MKLRNLAIIATTFFSILFTGCVSTNTIKKQIETKMSGRTEKVELLNTNFLKLEADSILMLGNEVSVKKKSSYFIPLIVYWNWKQTTECKLPNVYFVNLFNEVLRKKNTDFPYEKYLESKKLFLELTTVPSAFYYSSKGTYIFIPYIFESGIYFTSEDLYSKNQHLKVKYRLINNNELIKQGEEKLDFSNLDRNTSSLGLENYLENLKIEFEVQSNLLIDKIIDDL